MSPDHCVRTVKWLGADAPGALAIDGKGGKADLLEKVARWVAASGRNVTQPGAYPTNPTIDRYSRSYV